MDKILFSERLSSIRKERGFKSQASFARAYNERYTPDQESSGILGTIKNYENGNKDGSPKLDIVCNMCQLLDCDIEYLLGKIPVPKHETADMMQVTGLSEKAVSRLLLYKSQYSDNVDSLNFLLESDNLEDALCYMHEYSEALYYVKQLRESREKQIAAVSTSGEAYKPNSELLNAISAGTEKADLCEYNLSTRFGFIVQELKRKVEAEFNASKEG